MESSPDRKSIYRLAANDGPLLALPMLAVAFSVLLSNHWPASGMFGLPALLLFPWVMWRRMHRVADYYPAYASFYPLWLYGIYAGIFATLICSLAAAVYIIFLDPGFVAKYFDNCARALREISAQTPGSDFSSQADIIASASRRHLLPSPMELVFSMGWLAAFSSAVISALAARLTVSFRARQSKTLL